MSLAEGGDHVGEPAVRFECFSQAEQPAGLPASAAARGVNPGHARLGVAWNQVPRVGGEPPRPVESVRAFTCAVHPPVHPWSPRSQGSPRESDADHMAVPLRHDATSGAGPRRLRFTRSFPRISRAGSLRGYLECGLLCFGFARAVCMTCRTGFVVAFSCKGRGVCPSCNGRHMARDRRPSRRSRHPAGARAAVGDFRPEAIARHARRHAVGGDAAGGDTTGDRCDSCDKPRSHHTSRIAWAKLMARMGEEFPLECPACGGDIRLIAFITEPGPIRKTRAHPQDPHALGRTTPTASGVNRPRPAHRLGRARASP